MGLYNNPLYGDNQETDLSGQVQKQPNYLTDNGTWEDTNPVYDKSGVVQYDTTDTTNYDRPSNKGLSNNSAYGTYGTAAAGVANQALADDTNPALQYNTGISTIQDTSDYDKSRVVVKDNQFDRGLYYENYSNDNNPYDYNAGEGAKVLGGSIAQGAEKGGKTGTFGMVGGAIGGAFAGLFRNISSKRKAKEYEEISDNNRREYYAAQSNFLDRKNDELRGIAQQQQLANRGIPNYNVNAYNIG